MKKIDLIKELENVKLVIGNGFDLSCGIKTKYSDFFLFDENKNEILNRWLSDFSCKVKSYVDFKLSKSNRDEFWVGFPFIEKANFWDIFFFIISYENTNFKNWTWCDIEKIMESWLINNSESIYVSKEESFDTLYNIFRGKISISEVDLKTAYLVATCYRFNNEMIFDNERKFYGFLLDELKKFEKNFGDYIYNQQIDGLSRSMGFVFQKRSFFNMTKVLINSLCNPANLVSIDSFNYGNVHESFNNLLHHINGNTNYPIFGIDSNLFLPPNPKYIFSKTSRRMEMDLKSDDVVEIKECENLVIFGSSLSSSDYSYFFSVFDKIAIIDTNKRNKIVFAYKIYDGKNEQDIKDSLMYNVVTLFQEYSRYKGLKEQPNRLLDYLTTQGRVLFYLVD